MVDYTKTREALIAAGISAERLPETWKSGIDLSGVNLSGGFLRGANLSGANLRKANLYGADLSKANLYGANLGMANLSGANLSGANLTEADLRKANLNGASLSGANLYGADLSGAVLSGAYLSRADLSEITVNWQSHDLIGEILLRAAERDVQRRMLAGLILVSPDWCWVDFLSINIDPALREWALAEMRGWVRDGDDAPGVLRPDGGE
jgi:uncharacterized protein YjbI with pentapeptide repeats